MPDRTPDPDEVGDSGPTSGARRSGLDRLRAARGGASAPAEERAGAAERPAGTEAAAGRRDSSGSTAVLESTASSDTRSRKAVEADPAADADEGLGSGAAGRGRRFRRRSGTAGDPGAGGAAKGARTRGVTRPIESGQRPASTIQIAAAAVLTLLVIGLLVPVVLMRHRIVGQSSDEKAVTNLVSKRTDATGFATRFAVSFFSPSYKTIDAYNSQISAQTTGAFKNDFDGKRDQLKSLLTQVQSQATGHVLAAGVSKVSGNVVEVLVVVDQDVENTTTKGKTVTNRYRVKVTLQQSGKTWLVQGLDPVI